LDSLGGLSAIFFNFFFTGFCAYFEHHCRLTVYHLAADFTFCSPCLHFLHVITY